MNMSVPLIILAISANIANFTMALSAVLTIIVNRKFLPKEFRGSFLREVMLDCQSDLLRVLLLGLFPGEDFRFLRIRNLLDPGRGLG